MASLLVPHNTALRHPLLLEHSFGCYLLPIVTENISFKEIQCSPQRKFWHGKQGESLSLLRRQAELRMRWVLSREKKPAWVVTGRENSSGWDAFLRLRETIPEVQGVGSRPTGLPVFGLCFSLDWVPEPHTVPAFVHSEQRWVHCAPLVGLWVFHSLGLGCFLMKTRIFPPSRTEDQLLREENFTLGAKKKKQKQPTLFKSASDSPKKVTPKSLVTEGGLVSRNMVTLGCLGIRQG